jgi:hypothetical protein
MSFAVPANFAYDVARSNPTTLTDVPAGTVLVDASSGDYFLLTGDGLGSTRELDNPTLLEAGTRRTLIFEFDHQGVDGLTFDTLYQFGDLGAPVYPGNGVRDIITAIWNGSTLLCSYVQGYTA